MFFFHLNRRVLLSAGFLLALILLAAFLPLALSTTAESAEEAEMIAQVQRLRRPGEAPWASRVTDLLASDMLFRTAPSVSFGGLESPWLKFQNIDASSLVTMYIEDGSNARITMNDVGHHLGINFASTPVSTYAFQADAGGGAALYLRGANATTAKDANEVATFAVSNLGLWIDCPKSCIFFNYVGYDCDFRVDGDTVQNLLRIDAGNGRIGINGDATPDAVLDIESGNLLLTAGAVATAPASTTLGAGATTLAVTTGAVVLTGDGGANVLGTITGAIAGQYLTILFVDANITITDTDAHTANTVDLAGTATNLTSADDMTLVLWFDGTSWYQISKSAN